MDFLKIGKNKLKITLTKDELKRYKLDKIDPDADLAPHRRSLFRVIDLAGQRTGFAPGSERLLLQFYPTRGGGELFVTKLSVLTEAEKNIISRAPTLTTLMRSRRAYFFDSIQDAIALSKSIAQRTSPPESSALYITELGGVVLEVEEYERGGGACDLVEISEFSDRLSAEFFLYLREHSIPVYETDAIRQLSAL